MRDLIPWILTALVAVQCETIHFTNSPSHLVGSKNITSYKLLLKNSDPITIIEANKAPPQERTNVKENRHPNDRIDINLDDSADSPYHNDYHVKLIANMGGSHHVDIAPTQNVRGTVGLTITGGPTKSPITGSNDFKKGDHEIDDDSNNSKKVVYSPILLKKFMKEYSEKLQNADVTTKNEIQKIHEKIHEQQTTSSTNKNDEVLEFDKSNEEVEQKYGNWNGYRDSYDDDRRKRPSDPYKDRDGWVTLEAIPWSSSSVSKWHPHGQDDDTRRRPSPNSARPYKPDKFPYHDNDDDDYYSRPKPSYLDRDKRPSVHSSWAKPQSYNSNGRPTPKPYRFSESGSFGSHKFSDRDNHGSGRPWQSTDDIITDNRPSDFPSDYRGPNYNDDDHYNVASSNIHPSYQERPSEGNGEWVLISTTKGYQAQSSGNRRQKGNRALFQADAQPSALVTAPKTIRMHKALKLTVLPALEPAKNSTFSTDPLKKPTTTIHGGMLEIDATHVSIEDDVRKHVLSQKKATTTVRPPVKAPATENKNRKLLKGINFRLFEQTE